MVLKSSTIMASKQIQKFQNDDTKSLKKVH